jgi:hypothetical protein
MPFTTNYNDYKLGRSIGSDIRRLTTTAQLSTAGRKDQIAEHIDHIRRLGIASDFTPSDAEIKTANDSLHKTRELYHRYMRSLTRRGAIDSMDAEQKLELTQLALEYQVKIGSETERSYLNGVPIEDPDPENNIVNTHRDINTILTNNRSETQKMLDGMSVKDRQTFFLKNKDAEEEFVDKSLNYVRTIQTAIANRLYEANKFSGSRTNVPIKYRRGF